MAAVLPQGPGKSGPNLEGAKHKLVASDEASVNAGAAECLAANNPEGAELLLKTMSGSQPHMRDIAFSFLEKFTNPYAIQVIENACNNFKDENVRAWCADLLGAYFAKVHFDPLFHALAENNVDIKSSAARALGRLKSKDAVARLAPLKAHNDPLVRANAIIAWALCDPKTNGKGLVAAVNDKDAGVRTALLAAVPLVAADQTLPVSKGKITDPDWRVRLQAVLNLAEVRQKESVAALVISAGDNRRIVAKRAEEALVQMTGKGFHGGQAWKTWWDAEGEKYELPNPTSLPAGTQPGAPSGETGVFFGLPIDSDHVAFFIDCGATMANQAPGGGMSKMQQVLGELETTLKAIPQGTRFNVYAYSSHPTPWQPKPQILNEKSMKAALDFLRNQTLAGNKNIWEALRAALADPDIDTVYLMSDGEPEDGLFVHYNRVVDHLQRINILRKLVVHTVHVSDPGWTAGVTEWYRSQLREIAKGTGGKYVEK
ncbi:MAG: HEAT repeat domain-containing protein [Planctomycetes bacterium]|nr:HEAT repeat domain-containing protein [Planctomycetota bacterium]